MRCLTVGVKITLYIAPVRRKKIFFSVAYTAYRPIRLSYKPSNGSSPIVVPQYRPESFGSTHAFVMVDSDLMLCIQEYRSGLLIYCVHHSGGASIPGRKLTNRGNLFTNSGAPWLVALALPTLELCITCG